jgi:hypothetical protein
MADDQRRARLFGVLFLITFITSIAALALFQSVLDFRRDAPILSVSARRGSGS